MGLRHLTNRSGFVFQKQESLEMFACFDFMVVKFPSEVVIKSFFDSRRQVILLDFLNVLYLQLIVLLLLFHSLPDLCKNWKSAGSTQHKETNLLKIR